MSAQYNRKIRERFLLEGFLSLSNINAEITEEGESPDFGIALDSRIVGVEITEIFVPAYPGQEHQKAQESLRSRIVDAAKREYENRYGEGKNVHATVVFYTGMDYRNIRRDTVAEALATLIHSLPLTVGRHTSWHNNFETFPELEVVAYVSVLPVPSPRMAHWVDAEAGWVSPLTNELLESSILTKNNLIQTYRMRYSEVWLIIATIGDRPSQFFNLDKLPDFSKIHSKFDKNYFFSSMLGQVFPIGGNGSAPST